MDLNFEFACRHIAEGLRFVEENEVERRVWPEVIARGLVNNWEQCQREERRKMSQQALAPWGLGQQSVTDEAIASVADIPNEGTYQSREGRIMPSSPMKYKVSEGTAEVKLDEVIELRGGNYAINISSQYTTEPSYYLMGEVDEEWGEVENIEGWADGTSCDFLRTVNLVFNSQFACADAGFDCMEDNPGNVFPCTER